MNIVIYGTTVEKITSVLDSGILENCDCSIVGVCTDELVLGESAIKSIPILQIDDVACTVALLDDGMPDAYRKVLREKGITSENLDSIVRLTRKIASNVVTAESPSDVQEANHDTECVADAKNVEDSEVVFDAPNQENSEIPEQTKPYFTDEQAEEMRGVLTTWLEKIYQAVNNTKNKDTSIYNINKELQKFKDGYYGKITSPITSEMITLREDYKKSIEDCSKFDLNYEKQISYLECTVDQIDEILATYNVEAVDGKYSYNGKVIYPVANNAAEEPINFESEYAEIEKETKALTEDVNEVKDCASLEKFLTGVASNVEAVLQNNEALIKSIEIQNSDLKKQLAVTDGLVIIPLLRKIIRMKLAFLSKREMIGDFKEDSEAIYREAYEYGIKYTETILQSLGVSIRDNLDDEYDPKHHRILKMQKISPEEAEKDKKIAAFVTDCYVSDERVLAPAKVIVYKL